MLLDKFPHVVSKFNFSIQFEEGCCMLCLYIFITPAIVRDWLQTRVLSISRHLDTSGDCWLLGA